LRLGQTFLDNRKKSLKELNYITDQAKVNINSDKYFTFYHYTHEDKINAIMAEGLWAYREVACPTPPEELKGCYLVEGFVEPLPSWLTTSVYLNNLGIELTNKHIGCILLEVSVSISQFKIYIADYSHILDCKMVEENKGPGIGFGYDCSNGRECTQAYVHSYLEINEYVNQHHAPLVQVVRQGSGLLIPNKFIKKSAIQPCN